MTWEQDGLEECLGSLMWCRHGNASLAGERPAPISQALPRAQQTS